MKANRFSLTSACLLILMVCISCIPLESLPTATPSFSLTPTFLSPTITASPTHTSSAMLTKTPVRTQTPIVPLKLDISQLPEGQYVVYTTYEYIDGYGEKSSVLISNLDKTFQIDLGSGKSDQQIAYLDSNDQLVVAWVTTDENQIVFQNAIKQEIARFSAEFEPRCYPGLSISSDGETFTIGCDGHLLIYSLQNGQVVCDIGPKNVLNEYQEETGGIFAGETSWSPDGRWIAFNWQFHLGPKIENEYSGIYLVEVSKDKQDIQCGIPEKINNLIGSAQFAWTNSNLLSLINQYDTKSLEIYDPISHQKMSSIPLSDPSAVFSMVWAPDDTFFMYDYERIYIMSVETGAVVDWLVDGEPLLWISITP